MADETPKTIEDLKTAIKAVLPQLQEAALEQAELAIQDLAKAGTEFGSFGVKVLQSLSDVSMMRLRGLISKETAELTVGNYLEALKNLAQGLKEAAATEAYERGLAFLERAKKIGLTLVEIALQVGLAQVAPFLGPAAAAVGGLSIKLT